MAINYYYLTNYSIFSECRRHVQSLENESLVHILAFSACTNRKRIQYQSPKIIRIGFTVTISVSTLVTVVVTLDERRP